MESTWGLILVLSVISHKRYVSAAIQFIFSFLCSLAAFSYDYMLSSDYLLWDIFGIFWLVFSWILYLYFLRAFYVTLRDNIPRFVQKKYQPGLFSFTLMFFEVFVMSILFWFLWIILSFTNSRVCWSSLCSGIIIGGFVWVNVMASLGIATILRCKKNFGITIAEAFGINRIRK